ncbi:HDOD domain-containing protein [Ectothiorhodospira sp. PHS-1]|uniref:HDOD domain-containing protein n=1 Tax=Ectothiorhodospira sp. PHS-1 TaxID=519989 RepID=UPI0002DA9642|nr:HDOD domain-containing protein [Ectothiorhodospira sp. PHS-1]
MAQENLLMETMPSLPQVLLNILDAIQDEQADLRSLGEIILQDPAMTARLVAVANSAHYARAGGCHSLDRAVMILGQRTVKNVVMTAAMKQVFDEFGRRHRRFLKESWRGTLVTAALAQALAALTRYPRPEEAYLCGLLVNLGRLDRLTLDEARYPALLEAAENDQDLIRREQATYGGSHCELAAGLMEQWGLSPLSAGIVTWSACWCWVSPAPSRPAWKGAAVLCWPWQGKSPGYWPMICNLPGLMDPICRSMSMKSSMKRAIP